MRALEHSQIVYTTVTQKIKAKDAMASTQSWNSSLDTADDYQLDDFFNIQGCCAHSKDSASDFIHNWNVRQSRPAAINLFIVLNFVFGISPSVVMPFILCIGRVT